MTVGTREVRTIEDVLPEREHGCTVDVHRMNEDTTGSTLCQAVLRCHAGRSQPKGPGAGRQEVLFVLSGKGTLHVDGAHQSLRPDIAVLVGPESSYEVEVPSESAPMVAVSVGGDVPPGVTVRAADPVIDLADQIAHDAVSDREYRILYGPDNGCGGMTAFVGNIPQIRTPRHYHEYSEMLCVLSGEGRLETDDQVSAISSGSCFYLPAGLRHLVENLGSGYLRLLGVFSPAGNPDRAIPVE